jgi:hypothetical protein
MNKATAKKLAYSEHNITYRKLKDMIYTTNTNGISKVNKGLSKEITLNIFKDWIAEKENNLDDIINSTTLKRNSCTKLTLNGNGLAMVNILIECTKK